MLSCRKIVTRVVARNAFRHLSAAPPGGHPVQNFKFETINELLEKQTVAYSSNHMLGTKVGNEFQWMTYTEFELEVRKGRTMLNELKVGYDDKVALISNNRTEWAVLKYSANGVGGQIVPM